MQAGNVARQIVKSLSRGPARRIDVDAVQAFEDVDVLGNVKIRNDRLAEALEIDNIRILLPD